MSERFMAADLLVDARKVIEDEDRWGQHHYATDAVGCECWPGATRAARFCALGAMQYVEAQHVPSVNSAVSNRAREALTVAVDKMPPRGDTFRDAVTVSGFNDHPATTHADVLKLFDVAIEVEAAGRG